jgi:hypothetical protein
MLIKTIEIILIFIPTFIYQLIDICVGDTVVARNFINDEWGQLVGTPLKLVIAVVIGVAVLGILLQMMNLVSVMNPHSFNVEEGTGFNDDRGIWAENSKRSPIVFTVRDESDGRTVQGAIVEIKGAGANEAQVTDEDGVVSFSGFDFELSNAPYAKTTVTVTKEGYSRWTNSYLVKPKT